jgi:hypothetical protein
VAQDLYSEGSQPVMHQLQRRAAGVSSQDVRFTAQGLGQAGDGEDSYSQSQQPVVQQPRRPAAAAQLGAQGERFIGQIGGDEMYGEVPQPHAVVRQRSWWGPASAYGSQHVGTMGQAVLQDSHSQGQQPVMHQRRAAAAAGSQDGRRQEVGQAGGEHELQYSRPPAAHSMALWAGSSSWEAYGALVDRFTVDQCQPTVIRTDAPAAAPAAPQGSRRGTGMLAKVKRADAVPAVPPAPPSCAAAAPAAQYSTQRDVDDTGIPLDVDDAVDSNESDYGYGFSRVRKAGKAVKAAAASAPTNTHSTFRGSSSSRGKAAAAQLSAATGSSSSGGGTSSGRMLQPGRPDWAAALKSLMSVSAKDALKWRAILPSGDRVGPFSSGDMVGWLAGGGRAPKGVSGADVRALEADQGVMMVCGIVGSDYSAHKLPGGWGEGTWMQ